MVSLLRWFQKNPPLEAAPEPEPTFPILVPAGNVVALIEQLGWELPSNWVNSIIRFHSEGLSHAELGWLAAVAHANKDIPLESKFRYFCGCCWRVITGTTTEERRALRVVDRHPYE